MKKALLLTLILLNGLAHSQSHKIDSLLKVLKIERDDTAKVKTLNRLAEKLRLRNPDTSIILARQAEVLATELKWEKGIGPANTNIGLGYYDKGEYPYALEYYKKALANYDETGNKTGQAGSLGNIGNIYGMQGDYPKAVDYLLKALKIYEALGDKYGEASALGNIGGMYCNEHNYTEALTHFTGALKIFEQTGYLEGQAQNLGNIGSVYTAQGDYCKALEYMLKALKIEETAGNIQGEFIKLGNIASIYGNRGDSAWNKGNTKFAIEVEYPKALEYDLKALKLAEKVGSMDGKAFILGCIGIFYTRTGKKKEAEEDLTKAITIDSSIGQLEELSEFQQSLSDLYSSTGRYKQALYWYQKSMALKDQLFNIDKDKALMRKELTYKFEHQQDSTKDAQSKIDAVNEEQLKNQRIGIYAVSGGLVLVLLLALSIFRSLQQNRKKTKIIEQQKTEVERKNLVIEEKNRDILDSITYAKRLQDAILPPISLIEKYFPESFVLYKPKDIVAGDFYWMEREGDVTLIAAADCTGHGVPGALVSVVCSNALNRAVKEFKLRNTGLLLDKVRELVLETFEKSEGNIQDGMDISFCAINTVTNNLEWSGAYNPLWYIQDGTFYEVTADKQPIGIVDNPKAFSTHSLNLKKGTVLYLFTDGFADQFGGPKGKKFKYKQFQERLMALHVKPMREQKEILENEFNAWKGEFEQTDDVSVIGIRIC